MESIIYFLAPFIGYIVAGSIKFIIHSLKARQLAFNTIGLGGMPSTHNTITATVASLIIFREGISSPIVSLAICLALIVAIDSLSLRKHIEKQAIFLHKKYATETEIISIRKKISHNLGEVIAGWFLGFFCGFMMYKLILLCA